METKHSSWLDGVDSAMGAAGNPYTSKSAPSITVLESESDITAMLTFINGRITDIGNLTHNVTIDPDEIYEYVRDMVLDYEKKFLRRRG